jgi:hypothetical protein
MPTEIEINNYYLNPLGYLRGLYTQTSSSTPVTNTTVAGSLIGNGLGSLSIPANGFKIGDSFRGVFEGHLSAKNNQLLRIIVRSNGAILADTGNITMPQLTNRHWTMWIDFTVRSLGGSGIGAIASGGQFTYLKDASNAFEGSAFSIINNTTFDTTVLNTLVITAQWGSSDPLNSIYSEIFTLTKTY